MLGQAIMDIVSVNRVRFGSVYTIYTKHPEPPSHTLYSYENDILPLLSGTEKSTLMLNLKPWLKQLVI